MLNQYSYSYISISALYMLKVILEAIPNYL
jgi:hypothetical protein